MSWPRCEAPPLGTSDGCPKYATYRVGKAPDHTTYVCTEHILRTLRARGERVYFERMPMEVDSVG